MSETQMDTGLSHLTDLPPPFLFNPWKHHAGFLRRRIAAVRSPDDLATLATNLRVLGTDLMDLYHGPLDLPSLGPALLAALGARLAPDVFTAWLTASAGHVVITLPADTSRWVLRLGPAPRYIHVHPGRRSPHTIRVRATVLKTAVAALAHAHLHGSDPLSRAVLNTVRRDYLALPPLGVDATTASGLGAVVALLRQEETPAAGGASEAAS